MSEQQNFKELSRRITELREICGYTRETLAKELNMARMTFSRCLHSLINSGFIKPRGNLINRYTLTELGIKVVKTINRL